MPVVSLKSQYGTSQEGYVDQSDNVFTTGVNNSGIKTTRSIIWRFTHLPIPKNSTINSAKLHVWHSAKNPGNAQSFTYRMNVDENMAGWLEAGRNETAAHRSWVDGGAPNGSSALQTYNWIPNVGDQIVALECTLAIQTLVNKTAWTTAGGTCSLLMATNSVTNSDQQYIHFSTQGYPGILEVDYTPPVSDGLSTVVNIQDNQNFTRATNSAAAFDISPFGFNQWFGTYTQPIYAVLSGASVPAGNPYGNKALRVTAPASGTPRTMVHIGAPVLDDGEWYNLSCWVYVPTGSPSVDVAVLGTKEYSDSGPCTVKDQWVRIHVSFIATGNESNWGAIAQVGGTYPASSVFWVTNVQLTKGRLLRPYIDGNRTLTGATYGWAGPVGYNGYVRAVAPTVTLGAISDKARSKFYGISWTYSNSSGHTQTAVEVKNRRIR